MGTYPIHLARTRMMLAASMTMGFLGTPHLAVTSPPQLQAGSPSGAAARGEILVTQKSANPLKYEYFVINNSKVPIRRIVLGLTREHNVMEDIPENTPMAVAAPSGWTARHSFVYESKYMTIVWKVGKMDDGIKAGERLGGFEVMMPPRSSQKTYDEEGREIAPLDMLHAPFGVYFLDYAEEYCIAKESTHDPKADGTKSDGSV